jgi:uncharacterized membrane protein YccC
MSEYVLQPVHCMQCVARDPDAAVEVIQRLEAERTAAVKEARTERAERARHQADAGHYRAEARKLAGQVEQIGDALRAALASARQASEDNPGHSGLAARVRQADASYRIYTACIEGQVKP